MRVASIGQDEEIWGGGFDRTVVEGQLPFVFIDFTL